MPASSSSFGPNCWLWSGKKWKICIFSMKCTDRQWSTKEENSVLYLPIWLLLVGRYFLYHLGDLPIVSKKKWVMVGLRKMEQDTSILQNLQTYSETSAMCLCLSLTQSMSSSFSRACFSEPSLDLYLATNITTLLASAMWEFYTFKNYYMMP